MESAGAQPRGGRARATDLSRVGLRFKMEIHHQKNGTGVQTFTLPGYVCNRGDDVAAPVQLRCLKAQLG